MFKANIEVDNVDDFKKLTEVKVVEVEKTRFVDRVKKVKVPEVQIKEVEKIKKVIRKDACATCGGTLRDNAPEILPVEFHGLNNEIYKVKFVSCENCGNSTHMRIL